MDRIQRGSKRNFTIVQNVIFDLDLSIYAKMVYVYLNRCADTEGHSFPSYKTIAEKCSCSRRTAIDAIKALQDIGLLSVKKRMMKKNEKLIHTSNLYTIYDEPTPGVVQEMHHPSAGDALGVVQEMHHPSAGDAPNQYPITKTHIINTQSINSPISDSQQTKEVLPLDGLIDESEDDEIYLQSLAEEAGVTIEDMAAAVHILQLEFKRVPHKRINHLKGWLFKTAQNQTNVTRAKRVKVKQVLDRNTVNYDDEEMILRRMFKAASGTLTQTE